MNNCLRTVCLLTRLLLTIRGVAHAAEMPYVDTEEFDGEAPD